MNEARSTDARPDAARSDAASPDLSPHVAGFRRRYAAYSLDFVVLASLAALLNGSRLDAAWQRVHDASLTLTGGIGQLLADALMTGTTPRELAAMLEHDPAIVAATDALQAGLWQMLLAWLLAYVVLAALWHVGGELSRWQGSPGKHLLGMRVADLDDAPLRLPRACARFAACALSWLTLNLGHLLAAMPPQKRALHDYVAGTRVVRDDPPSGLPAWATAWLWLQVAVVVGAFGWVLLRYYLALQSSLGLA